MKQFKKTHSLVTLAALFFAAILCSSCDSAGGDEEKSETISVVKLGKVYTAGYSTGSIRAYYWVDSALKTITDSGEGVATKAASVVPTNFGDYVAGARTDFEDPVFIERAILWFNGKGEFLDDASSFAFGAVLHNGKIYVAGWRDPDGKGDQPCVWEVNDTWTFSDGIYSVSSRLIVRHDLDTDGGTGQAREIFSDGSDIYVCGYYTQEITDYACYWKNDERTDLVDGIRAEAICVYGGKIYAGGRSASKGRYWIDANGYDISDDFPTGSSDIIVNSVAAGDFGLWLGGTYYKGDYRGFSWNSGTLISSYPPVIGAGATGSTDSFLGCQEGWYKNASFNALPWIEGTVRPRGIKMRLY